MTRRQISHASLLLAALLWLSQAALAREIVPDSALQTAIESATSATTDEQLQASLQALRKSGGRDYALLIPQLVYTLIHPRDDRSAMMVGVFVDRLQITPQQLRAALRPYRDSDNPVLQRQIDNLLGEEEADRTPTALAQPVPPTTSQTPGN